MKSNNVSSIAALAWSRGLNVKKVTIEYNDFINWCYSIGKCFKMSDFIIYLDKAIINGRLD
tara:strand:- start:2619 stop:2801 length:183 start_codon:yes stop_codon:yes gene_type:complete